MSDENGGRLLCILTDRGTEYHSNWERHEYQPYPAIDDIDHSKTKTKSPQTKGICERFHKMIQNEFYAVAFRHSPDEIHEDGDKWIKEYNTERNTLGEVLLRQNTIPGISG